MYPVIIRSKCDNCGDCISICPEEVFGKKDGKTVVIHPDKCIECNACVVSCPNSAIVLKEVKK